MVPPDRMSIVRWIARTETEGEIFLNTYIKMLKGYVNPK